MVYDLLFENVMESFSGSLKIFSQTIIKLPPRKSAANTEIQKYYRPIHKIFKII